MAFYVPRGPGSRFTNLLHSFAQDDGLPFASALTEEQIQRGCHRRRHQLWQAETTAFFTPQVTTWAFVGQYLSGRRARALPRWRVVMVLLIALRP